MSYPPPDISGEPASTGSGGLSALDRDVRRARLAQAAHFDALVDIRDAQTLRLAALDSELRRKLDREPDLAARLQVKLETGFPPRLWLDTISYVEMQPDPRTYRLVRQVTDGHETVAEGRELPAMVSAIRHHAAHRKVEADRAAEASGNGLARSWPQVIIIWLTGFIFGVLSLLVAAVMLGTVNF